MSTLIKSMIFTPGTPLWGLKMWFRYRHRIQPKKYPVALTGLEAERKAQIVGLTIARPILITQGVVLPPNDMIMKMSESKLSELTKNLGSIAKDPRFAGAVMGQLASSGAMNDPKMAAAMSMMQVAQGGQVPLQSIPGMTPQNVAAVQAVQGAAPLMNPSTCPKCKKRLSHATVKYKGKKIRVYHCKKCKKYFTKKKIQVRENPKGGIAVPEEQSKPSENGIEKAKEHFEEFNNKEATTIKRVKIALPDAESPIIEIPEGPVAVEYRSPKENGNPNQTYRHEIKHTPPQANMGFVKGKADEGDCILIYGKGIKIDDWIRG